MYAGRKHPDRNWWRAVVLFTLGLLLSSTALAISVHVELSAPTYAGRRVLLYRYLDPFTRRTELLAQGRIDDHGKAVLQTEVTGTEKGSLHIGEVSADIWLRSGRYSVDFPAPDPKQPRSVNGTTEVDLLFKELDRMDVNALLADLNQRLDGFISEDLATDRQGGMQAADIARRNGTTLKPDTAKRPGTLFVTPGWSSERVDTFEMKLRKFYAEVKDPWFWQDLDYGIAGLRFGPRVNDRDLFNRYLKDKPVLYDVPEYVRFITSFFADEIIRGPFHAQESQCLRSVASAGVDSLKKLFARSDFLKSDRLCELVMMNELYAQFPGKTFDRAGILKILDALSTSSAYEEHRRIAANMSWDLTAMRAGGPLPTLTLRDMDWRQMRLDTALHDATCLVVTASWCTYCEQEMVALGTLYKEYGGYVHVVAISLDREAEDLKAYVKAHPGRSWTWLYGGDDPLVMDLLRIRSIPAFFLLNGNSLVYSPAPPPSNGMAGILFKIKAQADEQNKLRPDQGPPPKR